MMQDLRQVASIDLGSMYLRAQRACDVHAIEREMHRRGTITAEEWAATAQLWAGDFGYCDRACGRAGKCALAGS